MKSIQKISLVGTLANVQVNDAALGVTSYYSTSLKELPYFLIELAVVSEGLDPVNSSNVVDTPQTLAAMQEIKVCLAGIALDASTTGVFAQTFCGDTKSEVTAMSDSVLNAIAKLLRDGGFQSKAFVGDDYTGDLTCVEWLEAYRYGFARASDEKLQQELEGMLQPEIGAW